MTFHVSLQVLSPRYQKWDAERSERLLARLCALEAWVSFTIQANSSSISWHLECSDIAVSEVTSVVSSLYPDSIVRRSKTLRNSNSCYSFEYGLALPFVFPLTSVQAHKVLDPSVGLSSALDNLADNEWVEFTLSDNLLKPGTLEIADEILENARKRLTFLRQTNQYSPTQERAVQLAQQKREDLLYANYPTAYIKAATLERAEEIATKLLNELLVFARGAANAFVPADEKAYSAILTPAEIAAVWHLPNEQHTSKRIEWAKKTVAAPAKVILNESGPIIGDNPTADGTYAIRIKEEDRNTHLNILGRTRMGKSTLMHHLVHHDIQAGRGVTVIDPHGSLVRDILRYSIPEEREGDVVVLDIADTKFPPPLNPLHSIDGQAGRSTNHIISLLEHVDDTFSDRMADTLSGFLNTLSYDETATLRDLPRVFYDLRYQAMLRNRARTAQDRQVNRFWSAFDKIPGGAKQERFDRILPRISKFYKNQALERVFCHPNPLNFKQLLSENKILLFALPDDQSLVTGEESRFVGALFLSLIETTQRIIAIERESNTGERGLAHYLYVDEVQSFITSSLQQIFSEAAKNKLRLTVANQFLGQLQGQLLESIVGNSGATISFQLGNIDASRMRVYMEPEFSDSDLVKLDKYHAVVKMRSSGEDQSPFTLTTRPMPQLKVQTLEESVAREQFLRDLSRRTHASLSSADIDNLLDEADEALQSAIQNAPDQDKVEDEFEQSDDPWNLKESE